MIPGVMAAQAQRRRHKPLSVPAPNPSVSVAISANWTTGPAPMGVFFEANATGFETGLPKHDLRYKWTFGTDTGNWSTPTRLYDSDKNVAYGPWTVHTFDTPGAYTVTCEVTDGTTSTSNTIGITATDISAYAGITEVVVSNVGNFTGKPPGAGEYTDVATAIAAVRSGPPPYSPLAIYLRRGEAFNADDWVRANGFELLYWGNFGDGADPRPTVDVTNTAFECSESNGPVIIDGIDVHGPYDGATGLVNPTVAGFTFNSNRGHPITVHDCISRGVRQTLNISDTLGQGIGQLVISELDTTDWMAFGVALAGVDQGGMVGCRLNMQPDASTGPGGRGDTTPPIWTAHGPYRDSGMGRFTFRQCEMFSKAGWSGGDDPDNPEPSDNDGGIHHQQCMRLQSEGGTGGAGMIERCYLEGGLALINCFANAGDKVNRPQDYIFEKNILVGTANSQSFIDVGYGRTTIRNNVMIFPNVPHETSAFSGKWIGNPASGGGASADNADYPIYVYNNTFVDLRDNTNAPGATTITLSDQVPDGGQRDYAITYSNNIVHQPNLTTPNEPYAPIVETPAILTPAYVGQYYDGVFDAQYATPAGTVATYKPSSGSSAINGAGAGKVALDDFEGTLRGGTAYVGAWESTG